MEDDKLKKVSKEWPRALRHELSCVEGVLCVGEGVVYVGEGVSCVGEGCHALVRPPCVGELLLCDERLPLCVYELKLCVGEAVMK